MKRVLLGLVLSMALVLAVGGAATAAPPFTGEAGSFFVFGEYSPFQYDAPVFYGYMVGAGFTISDGFALGVTVQFIPGFTLYGGFMDLTLGPVALDGEFVIGAFNDYWVKVTGLYIIDLDPIRLGVGGGLKFPAPGGSTYFLEAAASFAAGSFSFYGGVDYWVEYGYLNFKAGVSLSF